MRRLIAGAAVLVAALIATSTPAAACAGLIGPNGAVNLLRTTTFAGYHDGIEHYVTSFKFQGGSGQFGSLVPLPAVPTLVEKGGDWTLQRLIRETEIAKRLRAPVAFATAAGVAIAPPSPIPLAPSGLSGDGVSVFTASNEHSSAALGIA